MIPRVYREHTRVALTIVGVTDDGRRHVLFSHVVTASAAWRVERQALRWGWDGYRPEQLLLNITPSEPAASAA